MESETEAVEWDELVREITGMDPEDAMKVYSRTPEPTIEQLKRMNSPLAPAVRRLLSRGF